MRSQSLTQAAQTTADYLFSMYLCVFQCLNVSVVCITQLICISAHSWIHFFNVNKTAQSNYLQSKHPVCQDKDPKWRHYQIPDTLTECLTDKGGKNVLGN